MEFGFSDSGIWSLGERVSGSLWCEGLWLVSTESKHKKTNLGEQQALRSRDHPLLRRSQRCPLRLGLTFRGLCAGFWGLRVLGFGFRVEGWSFGGYRALR